MLFQRKYLLAASANGGSSARGGHWCAHRQRGAVGGGAQRAGVGRHGRRWHKGRVGGACRSLVCLPAARSSPATQSWAAAHKERGGGGTGDGGAEGVSDSENF